MTIGELKDVLGKFPDNTQVLLQAYNSKQKGLGTFEIIGRPLNVSDLVPGLPRIELQAGPEGAVRGLVFWPKQPKERRRRGPRSVRNQQRAIAP